MARRVMKRSTKKAPLKKRRVYRKRGGRRSGNVPEIAMCSVRRSLTFVNSNTMYNFNDINLAQFARAAAIAPNYQRYKIKQIKVTIKPNQDAFGVPVAGASQKSYLYYLIDKTGAFPSLANLEMLKQAGSRPRALDEKPLSFTWRPSVLTSDLEVATGLPIFNQYKVTPWLSVNKASATGAPFAISDVSHLGALFYIEQVGATTAYNAEIEVQFAFCKPMWIQTATVPSVQPQFAQLDGSPDGIVGGPDGITVPVMLH